MKRTTILILAAALLLAFGGCSGSGREKAYYYAVVCGQTGSVIQTLSEPQELAVADELLLSLTELNEVPLPDDAQLRMEFVLWQETTASAQENRSAERREYEQVSRMVIYLDSDYVTHIIPSEAVKNMTLPEDALRFHYRASPELLDALVSLVN